MKTIVNEECRKGSGVLLNILTLLYENNIDKFTISSNELKSIVNEEYISLVDWDKSHKIELFVDDVGAGVRFYYAPDKVTCNTYWMKR